MITRANAFSLCNKSKYIKVAFWGMVFMYIFASSVVFLCLFFVSFCFVGVFGGREVVLRRECDALLQLG